MVSLIDLPSEILHRIFTFADHSSRKQLRLTSAFLGEIAQLYVFATVRVRPGKESWENIKNVLKHPHLFDSVAKVWLDAIIAENDPSAEATAYFNSWQRDIVARLNGLPRLRSVVLHLEDFVDDEVLETETPWLDWESRHTIRSCRGILDAVMPAFAALPGLEELAIKELHHTYVTDCSVAEEVCQVLGRLRSLRLNIAHVHSRHPDDDYDEETVHTFFSSFASFWLMPTTANLEHLTLYSTLYFGFYPKCDITSVHFPRLKSLALGNYTFVSDDQLSWILSHGSTLRELYLDDCPILHQVAVYNIDNQTSRIQRTALPLELYKPHPQLDEKLLATYGTRWVDYLDAFNTGLPHLRHFRMGHGPSWWADGSPPFEQETSIEIGLSNAYMVFCDGMDQPFRDRMVYNIVDTGNEFGMGLMDGEVLEPSEEDKRALRELLWDLGQDEPYI